VHRQSAAKKETMEALTARCDEQNEELRKLKEELGELPGLREKVARSEELKSRLLKTEQWREAAKKQLEVSIGNLDKASCLSATLGHEFGELVDKASGKISRDTLSCESS
jgi:predicted  nucleic acid-binding Zn-ribbon protein